MGTKLTNNERGTMKKWSSRKFLMALGSAILIVLTEGLGLDIPHEAYWMVVSLVVAYIGGEAYVDAKRK